MFLICTQGFVCMLFRKKFAIYNCRKCVSKLKAHVFSQSELRKGGKPAQGAYD